MRIYDIIKKGIQIIFDRFENDQVEFSATLRHLHMLLEKAKFDLVDTQSFASGGGETKMLYYQDSDSASIRAGITWIVGVPCIIDVICYGPPTDEAKIFEVSVEKG